MMAKLQIPSSYKNLQMNLFPYLYKINHPKINYISAKDFKNYKYRIKKLTNNLKV
jgi:hypothetical protein